MNKEIICGKDATELIKNTVSKLCDYVALTLGPKGRNVIIDTDYAEPFITNDGVTIAKSLEFDFSEEVVAKIIKEASIKTCEKVGDGTTTSLVLLKSIYLESLEYLNKGMSPFLIKEKIDNAVNDACDKLLENSKKATISDLENIASISSGSKEIGTLIRKSLETTGNNGKIIVEESINDKTELEIINGMFLENGAVSSFLLNDRLKEENLIKPYILVTDYKIECIDQIKNILEKTKGKSLIIIAESFEDDVIEYLSYMKSSGVINISCINAPNYADNKTDILEDICIFTNAKLISAKYGKSLENTFLEDLGMCSKFKISRVNSIIYNEYSEEVIKRTKYIDTLLKKESSDFEKEILETRLANLSGGIAVIYAGAKTKSEMILNKMRIEDAVCAVKSALNYGYSAGGGAAYYRLSKALKKEDVGHKILSNALEMPIKQIIVNSGLETSVILNKLDLEKENIGFDASNNKYIDMARNGIIDSTNVVIESLRNASSIAGILLTTSLIIATKNKKEQQNISEVL